MKGKKVEDKGNNDPVKCRKGGASGLRSFLSLGAMHVL